VVNVVKPRLQNPNRSYLLVAVGHAGDVRLFLVDLGVPAVAVLDVKLWRVLSLRHWNAVRVWGGRVSVFTVLTHVILL